VFAIYYGQWFFLKFGGRTKFLSLAAEPKMRSKKVRLAGWLYKFFMGAKNDTATRRCIDSSNKLFCMKT